MTFLQVTGDASNVSGSFSIQYAGQTFEISVAFQKTKWPIISYERTQISTPKYYLYKILNHPSVIDGTQAEVVFSIVDPRKPDY